MAATDFVREPLQVVELVQPTCALTFGVAPCLGTGESCYGGDATCKSPTTLDLSGEVLIRFVAPAANRPLASGFQPGLAIPALISVDTSPTVLNVGAGNEDIQPLGLRAVAEITIMDFPHNDVGLDPYLSTRAYDPETRASFWSKWLARNPFHVGFLVRIYDGYMGDELAAMIKREYVVEKIDASRSQVRITAKDILRKVTDTNVTAPALSPGALSLALTAVATSFQVAGAVLADYPATGRLRINNEILAYTARALVGSNVEFTGVTRGQLNTTAAAHNQFDRAQRVLSYVAAPAADILYDLATTWGKVPAGYIDKPAWDLEQAEWRELYAFTCHITDPVPVQKLMGELCQQALVNIWWDERVQQILYRAQRPNYAPNTLTQEGELISDSVVIKERPERRVSQVYVYYNLRNPTLSLTDKANFANAEAYLDIDKERQYGGEPAVREIFCRWVNTSVIARTLASAYLLRFRDVRRYISFDLTAKDIANCWTGDVLQIRHFLRVDPSGLELVQPWRITSAETVEQGHRYRFQAEDNEGGGLLWEWVDALDARPVTEIGAWVDASGTDGAGNVLPFAWV